MGHEGQIIDLWDGDGYGYVRLTEDGGFTLFEEWFGVGPRGDTEWINRIDADQVPSLLGRFGRGPGELRALMQEVARSARLRQEFRTEVRAISREGNRFIWP